MKLAITCLLLLTLVSPAAIGQESTSGKSKDSKSAKPPAKLPDDANASAAKQSSTKSTAERKSKSKRSTPKSRASSRSARAASTASKKSASKKQQPWLREASDELKKKAEALAKRLKAAERTKLLKFINTGKAEELVTITGIGKKRADHIQNGRPFKKLENLVEITGIGEKSFAKILKHSKQL